MKASIYFLGFWTLASVAFGQSFRTIEEGEMTLQKGDQTTLEVKNINGNLIIESHGGNEILLNYEILAKPVRSGSMVAAREELKIGVQRNEEALIIYNDTPFAIYDKEGKIKGHNINDPDYHFKYHLTVKVPNELALKVSTVNDGKISINGVSNSIKASNINGPIVAEGLDGRASLETVNGDIEASFVSQPEDDSMFKSINGDISVQTSRQLSAAITFKSMNGDLYTDYDYVPYQPESRVKKSEDGGSTKYRLEQLAGIQIGDGQAHMSFETLNGDVYLKKN